VLPLLRSHSVGLAPGTSSITAKHYTEAAMGLTWCCTEYSRMHPIQ
jgi:hypothetical protein